MTQFEKLVLRALVLIIEGVVEVAARHAAASTFDTWHRATIKFRVEVNRIMKTESGR